MTFRFRIFASLALVAVLIAATYGLALAHQIGGSWPKGGGITLTANQSHWFSSSEGHMASSSGVTSPYGAMMNLYTDNRLEDRCRNQNGTWQPWYMYKFENRGGYGSYIWIDDTHGPFQNCFWGHGYKWSSYHAYSGYGINEGHWLTETD